jgi:hypothetical protein
MVIQSLALRGRRDSNVNSDIRSGHVLALQLYKFTSQVIHHCCVLLEKKHTDYLPTCLSTNWCDHHPQKQQTEQHLLRDHSTAPMPSRSRHAGCTAHDTDSDTPTRHCCVVAQQTESVITATFAAQPHSTAPLPAPVNCSTSTYLI